MKVTTWNVNGIRARHTEVAELVAREQPDVLCLQEIKASADKVPEALCNMPGYWCYWHGHKGYSGVGIHLAKARFPVQPQFEHPEFDFETRIVTARAGGTLFASIYVPNGGKDYAAKVRFLEALRVYVAEQKLAAQAVVLCGDLNVAREERDVHPKLRNPRQIGQTPEERAMLEGVIGEGLVDLGRSFAPDDDRLFTWWAPWRQMRERNMGWRLDYVLASADLAKKAMGCVGAREFGTSDHGPVTATFDLPLPLHEAPPEYGDDPTPTEAGQLSLKFHVGDA